jgi:ABC-2 type transport system ATP-binding protein
LINELLDGGQRSDEHGVMTDRPGGPSGHGAVISAQGLVKHFGSVHALDGVDLEVPGGTVFGLLGPNGAGKTTAIRILTTVLRPDAGVATVLGMDVVRNAQAVRERIGLAGQYAAVDENLSGRENLQLIGQLTHLASDDVRRRADELLDRFDLTAAGERLAKTYSGGMRRRLDLAAALVHRPPVLFLDEPTTGLDIQSRTSLWQVIRELVADGTTLLLTTQYLEEADQLADRIAVIDGGRKIAEGTSTELKARLGSTIVEITVGDPSTTARVATAVDGVGPVEVDDELHMVRVNTSDSGRSVLEIVRALDRADLPPDGIVVREPTLDDVFLTLTGHAASSDASDRETEGVA